MKNQIYNIASGIQIGSEIIHILENNNYDINEVNKYIDNKNAVKTDITRLFIKNNLLPPLNLKDN